jgi:hypothetical protein
MIVPMVSAAEPAEVLGRDQVDAVGQGIVLADVTARSWKVEVGLGAPLARASPAERPAASFVTSSRVIDRSHAFASASALAFGIARATPGRAPSKLA